MTTKSIQFHWMLIQGGETKGLTRAQQLEVDDVAYPDLMAQAIHSNLAEELGFESLLVDFNYGRPDPLMLAAGLAPNTKKIKFLVAIRSGLSNPTYFTQQVNTFASMYQGRILLNIVAGHSPKEQAYYGDFLPHDERYARTEEFLAICNTFWHGEQPFDYEGKYFKVKNAQLRTQYKAPSRKAPYLFIAGGSQTAIDLTISQGDCWMRLGDTPEKVKERALPVLEKGKEVGLRLSCIIRDTKKEAMDAAYNFVSQNHIKGFGNKENQFINNTDSVSMKEMYKKSSTEWLTPWLWTGAVRTNGASSICLVGTPLEIAKAMMEYKRAGITQYILSGWPTQEEMIRFGKKVIPLIRELEQKANREKTQRTNTLY